MTMKLNHLKSISATGLKSGDFEHQLEKVNLITGPSASGKTSRLDAIRLALCGATLLGRNPELKGRSCDVMGIARGDTVTVSAIDDEQRATSRVWARGKECRVVHNEIPELPPVLMDPNEYLSLSDAKKIEYAFNLYPMDPGEFSHEAVIAAVKNIRLEENTKETEAIINALATAVTGVFKTAGSPQGNLANAITLFKGRLKNAKADCDRMTKTVAGITALTADKPALKNPANELTAARAEHARLLSEKVAAERQVQEASKLDGRLKELEAQHALLSAAPGEDHGKLVRELESDLATEESAPLNLPPSCNDNYRSTCRLEASGLLTQTSSYQSNTQNAQASVLKQQARVQALQIELTQLRATMSARAADFANSMSRTCCDACGAAPEHWAGNHSRESLIKRYSDWQDEQAKNVGRLERELESANADLKWATDCLEQSKKFDDDNRLKLQKSQELMGIVAEIDGEIAKAKEAKEKRLRKIRSELDAARKQLSSVEGRSAAIVENEGKRAELAAQIRGMNSVAMKSLVATLTVQINEVLNQIATLEQRQREFQTAQADEQRNAQALIEHARAKADVLVTTAAIDKLEEIQAAMVKAAFSEMLKTINAITGCVIKEPIEYRDGEIGRWKGSTWIKHESFSGTEKALTYAGVSVALAKDSPFKIVMIDELGRLDENALRNLLDAMARLVEEGLISQFIGCYSTVVPAPSVSGVNLIRL